MRVLTNMKNFVILLEGNNFNILIDGELQLVGFFATRQVQAASELEATKVAIERISNEAELSNNEWNGGGLKSEIVVKMVHEMPLSHISTYHGFTFYPMNE
jgi:hypothetical protein